VDAERLDQCKYCGRPIGVLYSADGPPVWALAGRIVGERTNCTGNHLGGHSHVPRGDWTALHTATGWQVARVVTPRGELKTPWDEPAYPLAGHPDMKEIARVLDGISRTYGSAGYAAALDAQNERIISSAGRPPDPVVPSSAAEREPFSWDGEMDSSYFAPEGTACDGCGRDDLPVRAGPPEQKLCRYCDELRVEKPAGTVEVGQSFAPDDRILCPTCGKEHPAGAKHSQMPEFAPRRPVAMTVKGGWLLILAGFIWMMLTSPDNNLAFAVFLIGMGRVLWDHFSRRRW
jgi:hypothetical protein